MERMRHSDACFASRNALEARNNAKLVADWLIHWRLSDPRVVAKAFEAFERPMHASTALPTILGMLTAHGIQGPTASGLTALGLAVQRGLDAAACALLQAGADPNAPVNDGQQSRPLHMAQAATTAQALIAHGADVSARDASGRSPLHAACKLGELGVVTALIAAGADPKAKDSSKATPLHRAVDFLAAQAGSRAGAAEAGEEGPALMIVHALAAAGADVNAYTAEGSTALHRAAATGHAPLSRALLSCGADPTLRDFMRRTAAEVRTAGSDGWMDGWLMHAALAAVTVLCCTSRLR